MNKVGLIIIVSIIASLLVFGSPAYASTAPITNEASSWAAYIDPTAGGVLIQLLLVGVAGIVGLARLFWKRIFPGRKTGQRKLDPADPKMVHTDNGH